MARDPHDLNEAEEIGRLIISILNLNLSNVFVNKLKDKLYTAWENYCLVQEGCDKRMILASRRSNLAAAARANLKPSIETLLGYLFINPSGTFNSEFQKLFPANTTDWHLIIGALSFNKSEKKITDTVGNYLESTYGITKISAEETFCSYAESIVKKAVSDKSPNENDYPKILVKMYDEMITKIASSLKGKNDASTSSTLKYGHAAMHEEICDTSVAIKLINQFMIHNPQYADFFSLELMENEILEIIRHINFLAKGNVVYMGSDRAGDNTHASSPGLKTEYGADALTSICKIIAYSHENFLRQKQEKLILPDEQKAALASLGRQKKIQLAK